QAAQECRTSPGAVAARNGGGIGPASAGGRDGLRGGVAVGAQQGTRCRSDTRPVGATERPTNEAQATGHGAGAVGGTVDLAEHVASIGTLRSQRTSRPRTTSRPGSLPQTKSCVDTNGWHSVGPARSRGMPTVARSHAPRLAGRG